MTGLESVSHHISTLLLDHNCVIVPALGGFIGNYQSARIHPSSFIFNSPSKALAFNANLRQSDGLLLHHIVLAENITVADAERKIRYFVDDVQQNLSAYKTFKLPEVGRLMRDPEGNIQFIPDTVHNYLPEAYGLYSFTADPVSREKKAAIRHIERIKIKPETEPANKGRFLLPAAAVLLFLLFAAQLLIQTEKKGYDMAEVFGFDTFSPNREYSIKPYHTISADIRKDIIHHYRNIDTIAASVDVPVMSKSEADVSATVPAEKKHHLFYLIAGVFGKPEYAQTIIDQIDGLKFPADIIEKNGLYMVAVAIPEGNDLMEYRNNFAKQTHIEDAWVMKR